MPIDTATKWKQSMKRQSERIGNINTWIEAEVQYTTCSNAQSNWCDKRYCAADTEPYVSVLMRVESPCNVLFVLSPRNFNCAVLLTLTHLDSVAYWQKRKASTGRKINVYNCVCQCQASTMQCVCFVFIFSLDCWQGMHREHSSCASVEKKLLKRWNACVERDLHMFTLHMFDIFSFASPQNFTHKKVLL